jgi:SNF2 family DNA or RNA helicase
VLRLSEAKLAKLQNLRSRPEINIPQIRYLKSTFTDFDGTEKPFQLRHYQKQGMMHLVLMERFLLGDDTGLGKSIQCIAALCLLWERVDPNQKVLILTTKSASKQWAKEFLKFGQGVTVILCKGTKGQRAEAHKAWQESTGPTVMIMGYASARSDFSQIQEYEKYTVVFDEATAFKNPKAQIHQVCRYLSQRASRCWALTATLIKNHLMEGHGIYSVVVPGLFGPVNNFMYYYCVVEMMMVGRGRKIPRIVGYHPEKVTEFREAISPYFLGRPKHEVASELPTLTRQVLEVGVTDYQDDKYRDALSGLLVVGEGRENEEEEKETTKLTAITYCQQIVNHPDLIRCDGGSEKLDALIDLLTTGDLAGEKVIVFTRFRKMVDVAMPACKEAKVKAVRITGSEGEDERQAAQDAFQNPNSDVNVVFITMAGSDAINLQAAKAIIFYDSPWSAGDYIQILGRMIRIGSKHDKVLAVHLCARWSGGATIDQRVMDVLTKKMGLIEAVLGERVQGMTTGGSLEVKSELNEIFSALRADAEAARHAPK